MSDLTSEDSQKSQHDLLPQAILSKLNDTVPRIIPNGENQNEPQSEVSSSSPSKSIKLSRQDSFVVTKRLPTDKTITRLSLINQYSQQLIELLYILLEEKGLDDTQRISIETKLFELTSYIPTARDLSKATADGDVEGPLAYYPNEQISKILIENYTNLLKFSSLYFNLSLASHITKYLVEVIYSLQYWEVYHLLYLLPDLEYFLKLCEIEVIPTLFGPLIKPPSNYMEPSMLQGFEYPFPYPFYNYSYHTVASSETKKRKYAKINIKPYIDITLKHTYTEPVRKRPAKRRGRPPAVHATSSAASERAAAVASAASAAAAIAVPPSSSALPSAGSLRDEELSVNPENSTDFSDSDDERSRLVLDGSLELGELDEEQLKRSAARSKSGVIHQCHLLDPNTLRPCLKIFYGKNELLRHQEFVHATKKKIYKCIYCTKNGTKVLSYPRHDSLARHIRRKHGITGKENKMAVNYAKENVEVIDDPGKLAQAQAHALEEDRENSRAAAAANANRILGRQTLEEPILATSRRIKEERPPPSSETPVIVPQAVVSVAPATSASPKAPTTAINTVVPPVALRVPSGDADAATLSVPYTTAPGKLVSEKSSQFLNSNFTIKAEYSGPGYSKYPSKPDEHQPVCAPSNSASNTPILNKVPFALHVTQPLPPKVARYGEDSVNADRVNFNKPEGSLIKENFQKFRLASSPGASHSVILPGAVSYGASPPNIKGSVYPEESKPPGMKLPGISMYLQPEWEQQRQMQQHIQQQHAQQQQHPLHPQSRQGSLVQTPLPNPIQISSLHRLPPQPQPYHLQQPIHLQHIPQHQYQIQMPQFSQHIQMHQYQQIHHPRQDKLPHALSHQYGHPQHGHPIPQQQQQQLLSQQSQLSQQQPQSQQQAGRSPIQYHVGHHQQPPPPPPHHR